MGGRNTVRALVLFGLVAVSVLMLVPTIVDFSSEPVLGEDGKPVAAATLPGWYTDIFEQKMVLGLDLQGGIHLQYKVDVEQALRRKAVQTAGTIETQLKAEREIEVDATTSPDATDIDEITTVRVSFPDEGSTDRLDQEFVRKHVPNYEVAGVDGNVVTLVMSDDAIEEFQTDAVDQAIETIERRINAFGVAESTISKRGDTELVVQLPGIKEEDFAAAKEKLSQTGQLRFQIVDRTAAQGEFYQKVAGRRPTDTNWPAALDEKLKRHKVAAGGQSLRSTSRELLEYMVEGQFDDDHLIGYEQIFVKVGDPSLQPVTNLPEMQEDQVRRLSGNAIELDKALGDPDAVVPAYEAWFLYRKAGMSGENVTDASVGYDQFNKPVVHMAFNAVDADKFYEMTKQYTKELMAIMIDEVVYSAPRIKEPIPGGRVQIEMGAAGNQAFKEAKALVAVLKSGALQAPLRKLYDTQVGPSLGADSITAGRTAILVGFGAVVFFMVVYYKFAGLVANLALLLNVLFVMAGLTAFGATLTLPGIAGIVLTIGMAVDANVLIFERIREELRLGKSVRSAIDVGYEKAFSAIFDGNITTAIAAVVLYQFGSGPIRGFAVTLGIGIICSMYTALIVTRLVFDRIYGRGAEPARMSI
ncbi:MAG: protein translocase subunit SecD [bacterium]|nr:protein translocase subunit SecD [Myxococcales bacterium]MCB9543404.1 protein translocase subunit SecD [Myxococcales bacterium]MCB9552190.1 protein translocase subunit SecD [Myxococcales bacterium]